MNLLLETKKLSYLKELHEDTMAKGKNAKAQEDSQPEGINGIKMGSDEMSEDAGLLAAAAVPAGIVGWQHVRHKIGF